MSILLTTASFRERHYTVAELAAAWRLSEDTVRRLFRNEPGVIIISRQRRGFRIYETIRIPESVAKRVYARFINGGSR